MIRDSLKEKLDSGESAFGVIAFDPYSIDVAAHVGFDWIFIDLMFTSIDWTVTESLIRCCEGVGLTPVIRVQSNPWLGYDHRIAVDVTRLISLGAKYIVISNSCKQEIDECVEAARNWHQRYWVHQTSNNWGEADSASGLTGVQIIPQPECKQGLAELETTLQIPSIKMAFIGTTDPSMALSKTKTPNFYAKELWDFIGGLARGNDTIMIANTSWFKTMEDMVERVAHMRQFGVRMPLLQTSYYFFQIAAEKYLKEIKAALK